MFEMQVDLPQNLENMKLPSPELLSYYQDASNRIVWIEGEVDESLLFIVRDILRWNREDEGVPAENRKPISILIFSPGGCLYSALALIDAIEMSKTPVFTVNMGQAYSAGLCILMAGHKRSTLPKASAMLHKGSAVIGGTAAQVDSGAQHYKSQLNMLKEYTLSKTTVDGRMYNRKKDEDWYLDAAEMLKYGFVDSVVSDIDEILSKGGVG